MWGARSGAARARHHSRSVIGPFTSFAMACDRRSASARKGAGVSGAAASIAGMVVMTCYTEFLHAGQHLAFEPKSAFWKTIKERHLAHHFHNEHGNFGIAEFFWDRVLGTFYAEKSLRPRSATARNLGYTDEMAVKYPWVKEVTDQEPESQKKFRSAA